MKYLLKFKANIFYTEKKFNIVSLVNMELPELGTNCALTTCKQLGEFA